MANKAKDVKCTPAGVKDNIYVCGVDINIYFNKEKKRPEISTGKNPKKVLATDLNKGVTIKAYPGGMPLQEQGNNR